MSLNLLSPTSTPAGLLLGSPRASYLELNPYSQHLRGHILTIRLLQLGLLRNPLFHPIESSFVSRFGSPTL